MYVSEAKPKRRKLEGTENWAQKGWIEGTERKPKTEGEAWKALKAKLKGEVREPNEAQKELCEGEAWTQSQNERSEIHCEVKRQAKAKPINEIRPTSKL